MCLEKIKRPQIQNIEKQLFCNLVIFGLFLFLIHQAIMNEWRWVVSKFRIANAVSNERFVDNYNEIQTFWWMKYFNFPDNDVSQFIRHLSSIIYIDRL